MKSVSWRRAFWTFTAVAACWSYSADSGVRAADDIGLKSLAPKGGAAAKTLTTSTKPGQLNEEQLGTMLKAMGLEPKKVESRYDFEFKAVQNKEEWALSMTAVLSQDGSSIWLMAWLDELPKSAADVPRTALLRLLSDNDRLGNGKFFAYVATNRRFVLQRVIPNEGVSTKVFRGWLDDLGTSVADTYDHWSVASWKAGEAGTSTAKSSSGDAKPANGGGQDAVPTQSTGAPNFQGAGQNPVRTALPDKTGTIRK